jgi:cell division protein FtsI/penicillin-binding protein 2
MELISHIEEPGLVKLRNFRRFYPFSNYGSQLVGFTDVDDKGASGIELQYDQVLNGKNGWTILQVDAKRRFSYSAEHPIIKPQRGADIYLTIDKNYQTILEDNLSKGVKKYNARNGMAILMRPQTSEILAMCSYPGFNPNNPARSKPEFRENRVISDVFEPGSTFKVFPVAALLQEGIKQPDDIIYCENGFFKYYDHIVRDSKKYGWLSMQRVFENSSNIGIVKLVDELPKHIFYRYLKNFNFGSQTGIGLSGENSGFLSKPEMFSGISKGMMSQGYEIGSTALQITNAYCAVVNGGYLMRPFIVQKVENAKGEIIEENSPVKIRQVISKDVANILKKFMLGAVKRGTGKNAQIESVQAGGKTGTAQKYDSQRKRYKKGAYLSSFIGFAPHDKPQFVLAVFLDEPRPVYYGGKTAAPIFKSIMEHLLEVTSGSPITDERLVFSANETDEAPNVVGLHFSVASEVLNTRNIDFDFSGDGSYVISQKIVDDEVVLRLDDPAVDISKMPDLRGLSIREALKKIDFSKVRVKIEGKGKVKQQTVQAGTNIKNFQILVLSCSQN